MKRFVLALCIGCLIYGLYLFCHKQTGGFAIAKIRSSLTSYSRFDIPHSEEEIQEIQDKLNQPFSFLGKGGQAYAFGSADGSLVLKVFKMHNIRQYPFAYRLFLPFPFESLRLSLLLHQKNKLERLFSSCLLSYHEMKEETALLALNLNPHPRFASVRVTLIDKMKIPHVVSLETTPFALQKRGKRAVGILEECISQKDMIGGKQILDTIVSHIRARREKGFTDLDPCIRRNVGLLSDLTPFFIDIGGLVKTEHTPLPSFNKELRALSEWLATRSSELCSYLYDLEKQSSTKPGDELCN